MDVQRQLQAPSFVDKAKLKRKYAAISFLNAKKRSSALPAKRAKIPDGYVKCCSDGMAVVENYGNFKKSGVPARVMYFSKGDWTDFGPEVFVLLKQAFEGGKTAVEVAVDGVSCLVDFLHMVQIDLKSGKQRSVAWIDVKGKCFFPRTVCDGMGETSNSPVNLEIDLRVHGTDCVEIENCRVVADSDPKSAELEDSSEEGSSDSCIGKSDVSDSECPTSTRVCFANEAFAGTGDNLIKLNDHDREFMDVKTKFLTGLSTLGNFTSVVGVYRNLHRSVAGQSRFHAFQRHVDIITRKNGVDANIQPAWHGTSRDAVCGIIKHGFGQPMIPKHGAALGRGVYLAPEKCAYVSATYSDIDENGEQHMVLCRVILGNTELVRSGSKQCHPSNEEFDTGIDDLTNPRRYIVWSTHMNTHILPEYVVSFKVSPHLHEYWSKMKARQYARLMLETDGGRQACIPLDKKSLQPCPALGKESRQNMQDQQLTPTSAWMSFPMLFNVIEKFLSSSSISLMKKHYADYKGLNVGIWNDTFCGWMMLIWHFFIGVAMVWKNGHYSFQFKSYGNIKGIWLGTIFLRICLLLQFKICFASSGRLATAVMFKFECRDMKISDQT